MAKNDDKIELEGVIREALPNGVFLVEIVETEGFEGHQIRATIAGKMRMHYIRLVQGDRVKVRISPYDLTRGMIVYRQSNRRPRTS